MSEKDVAAHVAAMRRDWEQKQLHESIERRPERQPRCFSSSGLPLQRIYTPVDLADTSFDEIGFPGQPPFVRGPYSTMYRGRLWTMRQIAGFGTAEDTNDRFRYLISQGQTGLSVDFDLPTLMGLDSDDPQSIGEVGREGVAIDTLDDLEALFEGIDLESMSVSMTINPTAWILLAMYVALAQSRGNRLDRLSGTVQADILKEYIAQKEWIFPIRPSMRIVRDIITYCITHMPHYNPINISGYHISEAGANAVQELAFTMANGIAYVEEVVQAGVPVDTFAPRLAFYFAAQADFFEEVAKFRAARRIWTTIMKRFGAQKPESLRLRFHCQTAAMTLTRAQPFNNIVRTAFQALCAVLGGAQSIHTNGLDEAYSIPSEMAMKLALRTQQIIAEETGVPNVIDPLGGSYYVEKLTNEVEQAVWDVLDQIESIGGAVRAVENGYFQGKIVESAYETERRKWSGEQVVVGVNRFVDEEQTSLELHRVDQDVESRQLKRLRTVRQKRNEGMAQALLTELKQQAQNSTTNLMPITIEAVRARVSLGEIVKALKDVFGTYIEAPMF